MSSSFRGQCWFIPRVGDFVESPYNYFMEEGMTELTEMRQGSVGVWGEKKCWERRRKVREGGRVRMQTKKVGGEQEER